MIVRRLEKLHNIILPYAQRLNIPFIFVTARFKYNIVLAFRLASSTTHKTRRYKYKRYVETLSIRYLVASANHSAWKITIIRQLNYPLEATYILISENSFWLKFLLNDPSTNVTKSHLDDSNRFDHCF